MNNLHDKNRPLWQLLLLIEESGGKCQINCAECLALLEYDAELLTAGAKMDLLEKSLQHHLSLCTACQKKQGLDKSTKNV